MPYIYWQPRPEGGYANGIIIDIIPDHEDHIGWCILVQVEDNPHLVFHMAEPLASAVIWMVYREGITHARVQFLYGSRETLHEVFGIWLLR